MVAVEHVQCELTRLGVALVLCVPTGCEGRATVTGAEVAGTGRALHVVLVTFEAALSTLLCGLVPLVDAPDHSMQTPFVAPQ